MTVSRRLAGACLLLPLACTPAQLAERAQAPTQARAPRFTDIIRAGTGAYHTYRIPAIVATNDGTLLAFCEGRKSGRGDAGNIDLLVQRSEDEGRSWSRPLVVWDDGDNTCGNPTAVVDRETGVIWLAMTWNLGSDHESAIMAGKSAQPRRVFVTHSSDDGRSWAAPRSLGDAVRKTHWRWYATGPGSAIQVTRGPHKGRLLIPANHSDHSDPREHPYRSHVFWSDDHGKTWQLGGVHAPRSNESAVVERSDGSLLQAMRSYHGGLRRAMATSRDGGASWGPIALDPALDTPVCQASLLRYSWPPKPGLADPPASDAQASARSRILFSSPRGKNRSRLHVWMSYDEGKSWPVCRQIYAGGSAYSDLVRLPRGRIGVLFERDGYRRITLAHFDLEWLESDSSKDS